MQSPSETIRIDCCTVCGSEAATDVEGFGLRECAECGAVYAPEYIDPDAIYVDGYYEGEGGSFGLDVTHPRFQAFLLEAGAQRTRWLARQGLTPGRLLDVGAGTGEFLAAARGAGWEVAGAEPIEASAAIARARNLDVRTAMLADAEFDCAAWDIVSAFHVLEHVPHPVAFLRELAGWARPGAHVLIEVPNWASTLRRSTGRNWMHLRPLEHLTHFSPATLSEALRRAGLEPVAVRTPTFLTSEHTVKEAVTVAGRPALEDRLARLSPRREVLGRRDVPVPGVLARAVLGAAVARDERRGTGMVVRALAQVPV